MINSFLSLSVLFCVSSIDIGLITFNWFLTIFVDNVPFEVSLLFEIEVNLHHGFGIIFALAFEFACMAFIACSFC